MNTDILTSSLRFLLLLAFLAQGLLGNAWAQDSSFKREPKNKKQASANTQTKEDSLNYLPPPLEKEEEIFAFDTIISEYQTLAKDSNQLRGIRYLEDLKSAYVGKLFRIADYVTVKRTLRGVFDKNDLWMKPKDLLDVRIEFDDKDLPSFTSIEEFDFIVIDARLMEFEGELLFRFEKFLGSKTYDITKNMLDFNAVLDQLKKDKYEKIKLSAELNTLGLARASSAHYLNRPGFLRGKMVRITPFKDSILIQLECSNHDVLVSCQTKEARYLELVSAGVSITLAARFEDLGEDDVFHFFRGVLVDVD